MINGKSILKRIMKRPSVLLDAYIVAESRFRAEYGALKLCREGVN